MILSFVQITFGNILSRHLSMTLRLGYDLCWESPQTR